MSAADNIHATGLVIDGVGILLRGPSGAGKSILTLLLLEDMGGFLVADDRLDLVVENGELMMSSPAEIVGLIELRGRGIVRRPHVARAAVHLVVDLVPELIRMPEDAEFHTSVMGIALDRCPVPRAGAVPPTHQMLLVREALHLSGKKTT